MFQSDLFFFHTHSRQETFRYVPGLPDANWQHAWSSDVSCRRPKEVGDPPNTFLVFGFKSLFENRCGGDLIHWFCKAVDLWCPRVSSSCGDGGPEMVLKAPRIAYPAFHRLPVYAWSSVLIRAVGWSGQKRMKTSFLLRITYVSLIDTLVYIYIYTIYQKIYIVCKYVIDIYIYLHIYHIYIYHM